MAQRLELLQPPQVCGAAPGSNPAGRRRLIPRNAGKHTARIALPSKLYPGDFRCGRSRYFQPHQNPTQTTSAHLPAMSASSQPTPMDEDSDCSATSALQVSALAAAGAWAHATAPSACGGKMAELPADCVLQVLHHLDRGSLVACAQACRRWRELCKSVSLWHRLFLVRAAATSWAWAVRHAATRAPGVPPPIRRLHIPPAGARRLTSAERGIARACPRTTWADLLCCMALTRSKQRCES